MHYVYILRSANNFDKTYIGYSLDLKTRLNDHNSGKSLYTKNFTPWNLITYFAFDSKETALSFEKYLKSHSGKAFSKKHFKI
jgi:putative endonuclease